MRYWIQNNMLHIELKSVTAGFKMVKDHFIYPERTNLFTKEDYDRIDEIISMINILLDLTNFTRVMA